MAGIQVKDSVDILVGMPVHDMKGFYRNRECIGSACAYMHQKGYKIREVLSPSSLLPANRNGLVNEARKCNAKYLMCFDSDQTFQKDIIERLLAHRLPIVSALYFIKTPPFKPLMLKIIDEPVKGKRFAYTPILHWQEGEMVDADAVGGGGLLIEMSVFNRVPAPWFACPPTFLYYDGKEKQFKIDYDFISHEGNDLSLVWGEDVWFCHLAKECGFDIKVDTNVIMGHIGDHVYSDAEFRMAFEDGLFAEDEKKYGKYAQSDGIKNESKCTTGEGMGIPFCVGENVSGNS